MAKTVHGEFASSCGVKPPHLPDFTPEELARWDRNLRELEARVKAPPRLRFNRPRPRERTAQVEAT